MSESPIYNHDPIEEIRPDVFMVRGCIKMNALMTLSRNMAIVRHGDELTLINSVRLSEAEEKRLESFGTVKRVLRLGAMHGVDDAYYLKRYGAELWSAGPSSAYPEPKADVTVDESTVLPFPDAEIFRINGSKEPEAMLLLKRGPGLLLTCDAIQNYGDYRFNNWFARRMMPLIGFAKTTIIGPLWVKKMTPDGMSLESEFRRLLGLEFDQLLSAHGSLLKEGAHEAYERALNKMYPR